MRRSWSELEQENARLRTALKAVADFTPEWTASEIRVCFLCGAFCERCDPDIEHTESCIWLKARAALNPEGI